MINFENLDGFVVDLSTCDKTMLELENIMHNKKDREDLFKDSGVRGVRDYILNYYLSNYDYIFIKEQNVYQICEEELKCVQANNTAKYSLNDFKVGDVAFDTAFAEIKTKKIFDEFGNLIGD